MEEARARAKTEDLKKENDQVLFVRTIMIMTMINVATIRLKREKKT